MVRIKALIAAALIATPASAYTERQCRAVASVSEVAREAYFAGIPKSAITRAAIAGMALATPREIALSLIDYAYEQPLQYNEADKKFALEKFKAAAYIACTTSEDK